MIKIAQRIKSEKNESLDYSTFGFFKPRTLGFFYSQSSSPGYAPSHVMTLWSVARERLTLSAFLLSSAVDLTGHTNCLHVTSRIVFSVIIEFTKAGTDNNTVKQ